MGIELISSFNIPFFTLGLFFCLTPIRKDIFQALPRVTVLPGFHSGFLVFGDA